MVLKHIFLFRMRGREGMWFGHPVLGQFPITTSFSCLTATTHLSPEILIHWASLVAQMVKNVPAIQEIRF